MYLAVRELAQRTTMVRATSRLQSEDHAAAARARVPATLSFPAMVMYGSGLSAVE